MRSRIFVFSLLLAAAVIQPANAAGDAAKGKKVFAKCKACHTVVAGKHRVGPSLAGVVGRVPGTVSGYKYSKAMTAYGEVGIVWDAATLDAYLTKPRKVVKGTKMTFPGLKRADQRTDVIAYLAELSQ